MSLIPDVPLNDDSLKAYPRDAALFADISGSDDFGRPKARILLRHYTQFSDGSEIEHDEPLIIEKPILSVFKHAGYVNVRMDFHQIIDQDLRDVWELLERYSDPMNSVDYTQEELESGFYKDEDGKEYLVHFPTIALTLSPINREKDYAMTGINPAFYTLQPQKPGGAVCVLELTFQEDLFVIARDLSLDTDEIQQEALQELGADPYDYH